ncbi:MAG: SDR family NAD(P)-dependent oxidoreductase [Acidobacteriota bacterium]
MATQQLRLYETALRAATAKIEELAAEVADLKRQEPLAVIGIGVRFPGGATSPERFWELLAEGFDGIRNIPAERWPVERYYDARGPQPGRMYTRAGGFLDEVAGFDHQLFGLAPKEADMMDPQHRLLLEVTWEALENAGLSMPALRGSRTGVFVGIGSLDYAARQTLTPRLEVISPYSVTGGCLASASGRLAYFYDWQGPCLSVDTTCSSSLVALHLAAQSLSQRHADLAVVGGVNLILQPQITIGLCQLEALAPDGRCKTFDASANGYGRGEGCGVLVLKRLTDAQRDGDRIAAVLCGSAIHHDGHSNGFTAPNALAQAQVIRAALERARLAPDQIDYIEAHGTGTKLGDPIEIQALSEIFTPRSRPLFLGAVKSNIGHLEAAAGIASVIKVILMLRHQALPPSLHFTTPNPLIPWAELPFEVITRLTPRKDALHYAGVSSFGITGSLAHVILQSPPVVAARSAHASAEPVATHADRPAHLFALSANTPASLAALVDRYDAYLERPPAALADIAFTANTSRTHLGERLAVVATSLPALRAALRAAASDRPRRLAPRHPTIAFLFTGYGSQYPGMGRQLYETHPVFREAVDACDGLFQPHLDGQSIRRLLYAPDTPPDLADATLQGQASVFTLAYALTQLWQSLGVNPDIVLGHSMGAYPAAWAAGVMRLEDAVALVATRGRLMQTLAPEGAMATIAATEEHVRHLLAAYFPDQITIAAVNSPNNVTISGVKDTVDAVLAEAARLGMNTRTVPVSQAFHSALMDPVQAPFFDALSRVRFAAPRVRMISDMTGGWAVPGEIATPAYWRNHLRQPVRFSDAVRTALADQTTVFVEIGGRATLSAFGAEVATSEQALFLPSLRRHQPEWEQFLSSAAQLYMQGADLDWRGFDQPHPRHKVALPTYPFQRQRCWVEDLTTGVPQGWTAPARETASRWHPLLGQRLALAETTDVRFEAQLSQSSPELLAHHRVWETAIFPATAYLEMFAAAGMQMSGAPAVTLTQVQMHQALIVPDQAAVTVQSVCTHDANHEIGIRVFSRTRPSDGQDAVWTLHATGRVSAAGTPTVPERLDLGALRSRMSTELSATEHYQRCQARGLDYGSAFQGLTRAWCNETEALALIRLPESLSQSSADYRVHPALLDVCLQACGAWLPATDAHVPYFPVRVEQATVHRASTAEGWAYVRRLVSTHGRSVAATVQVADAHGHVWAELIGVHFTPVRREAILDVTPGTLQRWLYTPTWRPQARQRAQGLPAAIAAPSAIAQALQPEIARILGRPETVAYGRVLPELERLSVGYVAAAFRQLGWTFQPHTRFTTAAMCEQTGIIARHHRLTVRLLDILAEEGILRQHEAQWEVQREPPLIDPPAESDGLLARYPSAKAELALLTRCGAALAQVLTGQQDPLPLLFPDGELHGATALYQDSPGARFLNALVQKALMAVVDRLPIGRALRVVEVGAGTGGTTAHILPHLPPDRTEYLFTDISPLFLNQARSRFRAWAFVRCERLDIEQTPESQGFASHSYDVVVAANVLHATKDLRQTLAHIRQLLAPGGLLLLVEGIRPTRWLDLIFGLTDGWWRFADLDLRPAYPLLSSSGWQQVLTACGFTEPVALSDEHAADGVAAHQTVMIAQAAAGPITTAGPPGQWLVFADRQGVGQRVGALLDAQGEPSVVVSVGERYAQVNGRVFRVNPSETEGYHQLLTAIGAEPRPPLRGILYFWNLDGMLTDNAPSAALDASLADTTGGALTLVQALARQAPVAPPRLWLFTRGAQPVTDDQPIAGLAQSAVWGLGKSIALEHPELQCTRLDLDPDCQSTADEAEALVEEVREAGAEDQLAFRGRSRYVARLTRYQSPGTGQDAPFALPNAPGFRLAIAERGTIENLQLQPAARRQPGPREVEIQVTAAGLNFRDLLNVLDLYPGDAGQPGSECAGLVVAVGAEVSGFEIGDPVLAIASGSFARYLTVPVDLVFPQPPNLSAEEAATVPIAFLTASYALHHCARIAAGESVLIHAAAGGVGQAAIQLAQQAGARVLATASPGKWATLGALGVQHVYNSRTLGFAEGILADTDGQGVDVVVNCLSGESIPRSLSILKAQGRFVEIGKVNVWSAEKVAQTRPDVAYFQVDLAETCRQQPDLVRQTFATLVPQFVAGRLTPLPRQSFPIQQAQRAFRTMQQARHTGKLILVMPGEDVASSRPATGKLRSDGTYLITGGFGGLGPVIAEWLGTQGARHVVLLGRSAPSPTVQRAIEALAQTGMQIVPMQADVAQEAHLARVLAEIERSLPPLRGLIHAAGVLEDGVLRQLDWARFARVFAPKVIGSWNLHRLTRHLPLDHFVLFSSAAALFGSPGQANHAAANAFLDALAHYRRTQGLPGLSINWGIWADIGAAALRQADKQTRLQGIGLIGTSQALTLLERVLAENPVQVGVMPVDWPALLTQFGSAPFLTEFTSAAPAAVEAPADLLRQLAGMPDDQQKRALAARVHVEVAKVLGLRPDEPLDARKGFFEMGMDSLTSVELRNRLQTSFGRALPATLAFDYPTLAALVEFLAHEFLNVVPSENPAATAGPARPPEPAAAVDLDELSEAELEVLLARKVDQSRRYL